MCTSSTARGSKEDIPAWRGWWGKQWHGAQSWRYRLAPWLGSRYTSAPSFPTIKKWRGGWTYWWARKKTKKRELIQQKLQRPTFKSPGPSSNSTTANFSQISFLSTFPIPLYHLLLRSHSAAALSFPFMGLFTHLSHDQKWNWIHVCLQYRKSLIQLICSHINEPPTSVRSQILLQCVL